MTDLSISLAASFMVVIALAETAPPSRFRFRPT